MDQDTDPQMLNLPKHAEWTVKLAAASRGRVFWQMMRRDLCSK